MADVKKKFYKKWQFWVIAVVVIMVLQVFVPKTEETPKDNNTATKQEENKTDDKKEDPKKEYAPKEVAEYKQVYKANNKEKNGQYAVINIVKVEKRDGNIVVSIGAPTYAQLGYAVDEFLFVRPLDANGKELSLDKINLNQIGTDEIEAELTITGVDTEKATWLEIGPYKTSNGNVITFKVE